MPLETLLEMASNGALARDDLARCDVDGQWQPVLTMLDQSGTPDVTIFAEGTSDAVPTDANSQTDLTLEPLPAEPEPEMSLPAKPHKRRLGELLGFRFHLV